MPLLVGIGFSKNENPYRAAQDASAQAKIQINQEPADLVLVYATAAYSRLEALAVVKDIFPDARTIGASTSGIILSGSIESTGIAVMTISGASKQIQFGSALIKNLEEQNPEVASRELARKVLKDFGMNPRQLSLVFFDGLSAKGPLLLRGLKESFGQFSPIVGGGSFDNFHYQKTYQYFNGDVTTDAACALMIGGQIAVGLSSQHGWKPLGKPRIADRTDRNVIHRINGKKAISLYEEFFGEQASLLFLNRLNRARLFYPLGVLIEEQQKYILNHIVNVLEDGSLVCQGEVPQGAEVHIMIGNKDSCKQAAVQAAREAKDALLGRPAELVAIFESVARQKLLGRSAFQEVQAVKEVFGDHIPVFGMYTYGEFAPLSTTERGSPCFLQNGTINILALAQHKTH
ncbi:MAG TPA: FIST N-terminal domain-containing protein [Candidatus Omnitrophota bacterium]|nr:FIST N-terminal domain-containing protein [Candidatus Omnitrophota bacterium]HQL40979.1 FIST N-terminal domain-containing protein [Candidatus Omnitrophota bacterium]